eukprot:2398993-Pleurochrysis_carterae.AAC.1
MAVVLLQGAADTVAQTANGADEGAVPETAGENLTPNIQSPTCESTTPSPPTHSSLPSSASSKLLAIEALAESIVSEERKLTRMQMQRRASKSRAAEPPQASWTAASPEDSNCSTMHAEEGALKNASQDEADTHAHEPAASENVVIVALEEDYLALQRLFER